MDDNDTTNFYNLDVIQEFMPQSNIVVFNLTSAFAEHYILNHSSIKEKALLLLDINMPEKQGFELIEELEEQLEDIENLDVLIVSSSSLDTDRSKAAKLASVFGFIEKPLTIEKLTNALSGVM